MSVCSKINFIIMFSIVVYIYIYIITQLCCNSLKISNILNVVLLLQKVVFGKTGLRCNKISFNEPALCFDWYSRVRLLLRNAANVVSSRNVAGTYRSLKIVEILYVIGTYNISIKRSFVVYRLCNILYCFSIKTRFSIIEKCIKMIEQI